MSISFRTGDLFSSDDDALAHCVSADLRLGAGIAKVFKAKYGGIAKMAALNPQIGDVLPVAIGDKIALALVTKQKYYEKPTKRSMCHAILSMVQYCQTHDVTTLSIPRIGCGLDRMRWIFVERALAKAISKTHLGVTVWTLKTERFRRL
jgi:hypothetical protein